jgi:TolA-binding protein
MAVGLASSVIKADEAADQYAVAAGHYSRGQWKLAAKEFESYLARFPRDAKVSQGVFFLAEAQVQLGQHDQAAARFREYLQREPAGPWARQAMFRAGEAAYLAGHADQARPQLRQFLDKYPSDKLNAYTLTYLGQIALTASDPASAKEYFDRCLREFPDGKNQDECRFGLARALDKLGQADEAEKRYVAIAAKTGSEFADNAQFQLGALQYARGRFEDALNTFNTFDTTYAESPWRSTVQLGRGWALLKLNRTDDAQRQFQAIASDRKVGIEARYWLGLTQKLQKNWKDAAKTLLDAAASDPKHKLIASIRLHAGDALLHAGDVKAATEQFDQVLAAVGPTGELADEALHGKAQAALQSKDYATLDRLAAEFAAQHSKSSLQASVAQIAARSLVDRKEYQRAVTILEPLVNGNGSGEQAMENRYLLSLSYEGLARQEDALKVLAPVLQSASGQLRTDAQLAQGSQLVSLKRFSEAVAPLEAFLATKPEGDTDIKARGLLTLSYARTKQLPKAKAAYGELLEKYPKHALLVPITRQIAEAAYDAGDNEWSNELFKRIGHDSSAQGQDQQQGLSGLGWTHFNAGRHEEAAAAFEQLLHLKNLDPQLAAEAAFVRGQSLQKLGKTVQAQAMYDLVITKYPTAREAPDALWTAARLHDSLGQQPQAASLYQRLLNDHPKYPERDAVLYKLAWSLNDQGKAKESTDAFERLRREFPQSRYWADATFRLAQRAWEAKDYARANERAEAVLALKPDPKIREIRENALYLWGQVAAAENKWDQARKAFETLIQENPQSTLKPLAEYGIAESLFRQNDFAAAGGRLQKLVQESQERPEAWLAVAHLRLAQSLVKEKKWEEAHAVASQIAKRFPDFSEQYEADYVIGRYLANKADFDGARQAYRKVIAAPAGVKTETAAKAQFMIAESLFHQKNYEEAQREYSRLEFLYAYPTWQAAALLQTAKCHENLGEWKEAIAAYNRLLQTYPQTEFVKEATERLRAAQQRRPEAAS